MENKSYSDFLKFLETNNLKLNDFWELGDATSLSEEHNGAQIEFHRGPLLYALIQHFKPKKILEFGTGGGYSTLCMAKSLTDNDIDGKIYTIDRVGNSEKIWRYYKLPGKKVPEKKKISNKEIWESVANPQWIEKIFPIEGYSGIAMEQNKINNFDFCYIDGVHTYDGTKHDFLSFLKIAAPKFSVLFDDYIERDFYGVKEFVDKEVEPFFDLTLINSDPENTLKQFIKNQHDYGMIFFSYDKKISAIKNYENINIESFLKSYRSSDKRVRSKRYNIEKSLPFLKNIKFKFWKKS